MTNLNKLDKNKQNIINNDKILVTNKLANIKQKQLKLGSKTLAETSYAHKIKHYPVASKEWSNSVYTYEKNSHKTTTLQDKTLVKLIKAYFNSYSRKLEKNLKRIKSRMLRSKKRKTSLNGILSSKAEIKHSNDKAIITIYVYNSQKKYYFNKLKKKENFIKHRLGLKRPNTWTENKVAQFLNPKINRRINSILNKNLSNYNYTSLAANFVNSLFSIEKKKIRNVTRHFYKMFNKGRYLLEFPKKFRAINKKFKSNKKIKSKKKNIKFKAISKIESKNLLKDFLKSKSKKNIKSKDWFIAPPMYKYLAITLNHRWRFLQSRNQQRKFYKRPMKKTINKVFMLKQKINRQINTLFYLRCQPKLIKTPALNKPKKDYEFFKQKGLKTLSLYNKNKSNKHYRFELNFTLEKFIKTLYFYKKEGNFKIYKIKLIKSEHKNKKKKKGLRYHKPSLTWLKPQPGAKKISKKEFFTLLRLLKENYIKKFSRKVLRREIVFIYLKQLLRFNMLKFEKNYVFVLADQVRKLYKKNVEFNFVSLKYPYLDSSIFSNITLKKIKRNKKMYPKILDKFFSMFSIRGLSQSDREAMYNEMYRKEWITQNLGFNNIFSGLKTNKKTNETGSVYYENQFLDKIINFSRKKTDVLDRSLSQLTNNETKDLNINKDFVFSSASSEAKGNISNKVNTINSYKLMKVIKSIKHKSLNGVTIQLSGRLSKYNTASRSMSSLKYKGNVRNLDSSDKGLSTVSLRGYDKSNLQHSKFNSKVRTGSFGLKGWISSK